jgi:hypothetical protein
MYNNYKFGAYYQITVLVILTGFNVATLFLSGTLNDTITGAIIGVMVSLPFSQEPEHETENKE